MRLVSLLLSALLYVNCAHAQLTRMYAPEAGERSARGIAAIFEMWCSLLPHWSGQALVGVQDNHSSGPLIFLIDKYGRRDQFSFTLPDAETIYVHGLAVSS